MIIYIERIPSEGQNIEDSIPAAKLELAELEDGTSVVGDVKVSFNLTVVGGELLVRGRWAAEAEFVCSRCLDLFRAEIAETKVFYDFELKGRDTIDLTESVREDIILHFPVKPLCKNSCPGLCPVCGASLSGDAKCDCIPVSGDPRFGVLDRFRKKTS